ncbi:virulence protein RhuM/Fic/DOC family protein [Collinsella sp. An2]|uniref:virulence protein RhuM/Fic/DOC family protein n=1 Tax=Collinsella sp. An2 TaxID=1965585 RepID=UPI000B3986EF|nr:virulence protein RhuM/Fic/DOC family protein [Collinsella sp. An2]OUP08410.1 phosphoribosylaminoimidazolesuccinocarboxamide synthase [Collinsella sp. An2]
MAVQQHEIVLFTSNDGEITLPVTVDAQADTVWLTQAQMSELFDRSVGVISRHVKNVFEEKELVKESNLHYLQIANSDRPVAYYSLDVVISVGYRVKSQRGVEFRRWATGVLRRFIMEGHVENDERMRQLGIVARIIERLPGELASRQILDIVESYTDALRLLDEYDRAEIERPKGTVGTYVLDYDECMALIAQMRPRFHSDVFGREKDDSFRSSIAAIYQGFGGSDLYPLVEEKAANLLYFIIKNHSFVDGNKRIGCSLFLYFLDRNGLLFNGLEKRISDSTLVAVALMIAESRPEEKESMVALVMNFLA